MLAILRPVTIDCIALPIIHAIPTNPASKPSAIPIAAAPIPAVPVVKATIPATAPANAAITPNAIPTIAISLPRSLVSFETSANTFIA